MNPADFDAAMARRGLPPRAEQLLTIDAARRENQTKLQEMQERRNAASKAIGEVKRSGGDATEHMAEVAGLKEQMAAVEEQTRKLGAELEEILSGLPNAPAADVPGRRGRDCERQVAGQLGRRRSLALPPSSISSSARRWA